MCTRHQLPNSRRGSALRHQNPRLPSPLQPGLPFPTPAAGSTEFQFICCVIQPPSSHTPLQILHISPALAGPSIHPSLSFDALHHLSRTLCSSPSHRASLLVIIRTSPLFICLFVKILSANESVWTFLQSAVVIHSLHSIISKIFPNPQASNYWI